MGLFSRKKATPADAGSEDARQREEAAARTRREDAWRQARDTALRHLHQAQRAHSQARQAYDRYAPGPQKTAAAELLNAAADRVAAAEREFAAVDDYRAWSGGR